MHIKVPIEVCTIMNTKFVSLLIFNLFLFFGSENRIRDHPYHFILQLSHPSQPYIQKQEVAYKLDKYSLERIYYIYLIRKI